MTCLLSEAVKTIPGAAILDDQDWKRLEQIIRREIKMAIRVSGYAAENKQRFNRAMSVKEPTATYRPDRGMAMTDEEIMGE